jgi:hypothetical protein
MTLLGHVRNGRIELDQPVSLPEGAKVQIEVLDGPPRTVGPSLGERQLNDAGRITDAPPDRELLKRAAGSWSDDPEGLDQFLEWNRQQRKVNRRDLAE